MTHEIMRGKATYTLFIFGRLERCADVSNKIKASVTSGHGGGLTACL